MSRLTQSSQVRIALVILLGLAFLEYVWVKTEPPGNRESRLWLVGAGCPNSSDMKVVGEADYDWPLKSLDGRELSLADFKDKVVFVNVWATWCGPCREEMPGIQALHDAMAKEGVEFVIVSEEAEETVRAFVEKEGYTFPVYVSGKMPGVFETNGIPATFVVNRQGHIVLKETGMRNWNATRCHEFLKALVNEEGASGTGSGQ